MVPKRVARNAALLREPIANTRAISLQPVQLELRGG